MRKFITLILVLLLSTSFKQESQETWIGTFDMYLNEDGDIIVYYKGNVPQCMAKKAIDFIYEDCDTVKYNIQDVERELHIKIEPVDTCKPETHPIKTTRI